MTQGFGNVVGCGLLALAACGGSSATPDPDPSGDVVGTIRGMTFPVADVISSVVTGPSHSVAYVILSSSPGLCAAPADLVYHPGEQTLLFVLQDGAHGTTTAPTAPGTYPIVDPFAGGTPPARSAFALTSLLDATCGNDADLATTGVSGAITLTAVDAGAYQGTFDIIMESGDGAGQDHVTGSFNSPACGQLEAQLDSDLVPPCR